MSATSKKSASKSSKRSAAKKNGKARASKATERKVTPYLTKAKDRQVLIVVGAEPNPRRKGSKSAKNYDAMARFIKGKRGVPVATLLAETPYRVEDFHSDLAHEYIKVKKGGASA